MVTFAFFGHCRPRAIADNRFDWPTPVPRCATPGGIAPSPPGLFALFVHWTHRLATAQAVDGLGEHLRRDIGLPPVPAPDSRERFARLRCVAQGGPPPPF